MARTGPQSVSVPLADVSRNSSNRYLWFVALVSALGGFLFGYDWVVIGGAKPFYEAYFGVTQPSREGWAMSCALVGCLAGALSSGVLSDLIGRRRALLISALVFAISAIATGSAASFNAFVLGRIASGVAIGMASALSPVYIAEIAPAGSRGMLVCLNELTIVIGLLSAQTVNWLIARPVMPSASLLEIHNSWNGQVAWRRMFEAALVPAVVFFIGVYFIPESPRWLARQGRWEDAKRVLVRFGGDGYASRVLNEMRESFHLGTNPSIFVAFRNPRLLPVLGLGVTLAVLQQWCGINVIFNYAQEVFSSAGYTLSSIFFNIVITGVVMCVFTFIAIATVERLGRRRLMLMGCGGLAILYLILGALYYTNQHGWPLLLLVVAALACYAMTLAPITWVILSEIFPNEVRGACMAICTTALWAACFLLTYTFPLLNSFLGIARTFWAYGVVCAFGFFFVLRHLPETRLRTLEEIQQFWQV
jgi:sugar porter (SP) family MFS transporter